MQRGIYEDLLNQWRTFDMRPTPGSAQRHPIQIDPLRPMILIPDTSNLYPTGSQHPFTNSGSSRRWTRKRATCPTSNFETNQVMSTFKRIPSRTLGQASYSEAYSSPRETDKSSNVRGIWDAGCTFYLTKMDPSGSGNTSEFSCLLLMNQKNGENGNACLSSGGMDKNRAKSRRWFSVRHEKRYYGQS
jgi:hypothetical protein